MLRSSVDINRNNTHISLHMDAIIKRPWIISIRICSDLLPIPSRMKLLRIRRVNANEVILFWKDTFTRSRWDLFFYVKESSCNYCNCRCTKTYEIYFLPRRGKSNWINITVNKHVPFMSYHFAPDMERNLTTHGQYKVRAVDVFERKGKFSLIKSFNWNLSDFTFCIVDYSFNLSKFCAIFFLSKVITKLIKIRVFSIIL